MSHIGNYSNILGASPKIRWSKEKRNILNRVFINFKSSQ